ncbi:UNVERIFIED_CONTAM: hypothetical protein K2H54_023889 [Gekko kuhli]
MDEEMVLQARMFGAGPAPNSSGLHLCVQDGQGALQQEWDSAEGSDCKPPARRFTSSTGAVPASSCSSPDARSPSLIAEDDVFFGSMAEEREDASSPEAEPGLAHIHSSSEDLLSLDSALQGSEYYKDLGLSGPAEAAATSLPPEGALPLAPGLWPSTERPRGWVEMPPDIPRPSLGLEKTCHYLDEDCACSCGSGPRRGVVREELESRKGEGCFLALPGSPSASSRRRSWESPVSSTEVQHGLNLDTSEVEREDEAKSHLHSAQHLLQAGPAAWTGSPVIQVELGPLGLDLRFQPESGDMSFGSSGKWLRATSVPSPCGSAPSPPIRQSAEASLAVIRGIVPPPALEKIEKEHMALEQALMVQQVLAELKQHHRVKQRSPAQGASSEGQQNLTSFEFLSNKNEEATGRTDKGEGSTKVKRRLSSLRSRVTGSWQKEKGKNTDWEKEAKEQRQAMHGHDWHGCGWGGGFH